MVIRMKVIFSVIEQFVNVIGVFEEIVRLMLEVCNGNLEMVIEMYLDLCEVFELGVLGVSFFVIRLNFVVGFLSNFYQ